MLNLTLYKREMKKSWLTLTIFSAILAMYITVIVTMFDPEQMGVLEELMTMMGGLMAAMGMGAGATTLIGFMSSYLYGFILLVFPMVLTILCANRLIASYVDRGAMVSLLAAPVKRRTVAFTQVKVLLSNIFILVTLATLIQLAVSVSYFPGKLDAAQLLLLNFGLLCLHCFIGGICFFFSVLANDTKYSIGLGAGIPALMLILQMLSNAGDNAKAAKYLSVFTLYDPDKIIAGDAFGIAGMFILLAGAVVLFIAAIAVFDRKDLHI